MNEIKNELRRIVRTEIEALPESYISQSNGGLYENLLRLEEFNRSETVFMFCSIGREPDTLEIARTALERRKTVTFPFCFRGGIMEARAVSDLSQLKPLMLGIPAPPDGCTVIAPEKLDFIIVPALTYDEEGFRLGYGGGYYDRFLKNLSAFTAGVTRERLYRQTLPRESHDVAVKCVVTETRIRRF